MSNKVLDKVQKVEDTLTDRQTDRQTDRYRYI